MISQSTLIVILGATLLHFLWQGALVAGLLAVALHVLRGASPNLRYALCAGAMGLLLLLPVATGVQVYLQRSMGSGQWAMVTSEVSGVSDQVSEVSNQVSANNNPQPATRNLQSSTSRTQSPPNPELRTPPPQTQIRLWLFSWRYELVLVWLGGVVFFTLRLLTGLFTLRRLRKHATPLGDSLLQGEQIDKLFAFTGKSHGGQNAGASDINQNPTTLAHWLAQADGAAAGEPAGWHSDGSA